MLWILNTNNLWMQMKFDLTRLVRALQSDQPPCDETNDLDEACAEPIEKINAYEYSADQMSNL